MKVKNKSGNIKNLFFNACEINGKMLLTFDIVLYYGNNSDEIDITICKNINKKDDFKIKSMRSNSNIFRTNENIVKEIEKEIYEVFEDDPYIKEILDKTIESIKDFEIKKEDKLELNIDYIDDEMKEKYITIYKKIDEHRKISFSLDEKIDILEAATLMITMEDEEYFFINLIKYYDKKENIYKKITENNSIRIKYLLIN